MLASVESARKSVADLVDGIGRELHVLTVRSVASSRWSGLFADLASPQVLGGT
ncbi:hypothetical protein [Lentzea nigeriaca]|uniref:hypothetical protein n=1 Tax=Lentzea nigeriaca TaxID=1128665 RepID=UPI001959F4FC|nr:hypothetical protein [Lentzea nigeriaca]MBM7863665.1 hypothetical protein [Lentzea nigeriaca]